MNTLIRLALFFFLLIKSSIAFTQQLSINTKEIQLLIEEWNIIHNAHSVEGFKDVYADKLLFYAKNVSRSKALSKKKQLFEQNPEFRQRINSDIAYTAYTNGTIKCDFIKDVMEHSKWEPYLTYLLVRYENKKHVIVGESDYATDKILNYVLKPGEPIKLKIFSEKFQSGDDTLMSYKESDSALPLQTGTASADTVTVPRRYVFILIGILLTGGILIFLTNGQKRSVVLEERPPTTFTFPEPGVENNVHADIDNRSEVETDEPYRIIENQLKQSAFKSFLISQFDPVEFTYKKPKGNQSSSQEFQQEDLEPNLEFEFQKNDFHADFAIQYLYKEDTGEKEVDLFSMDRLTFNNQFEGEIDLYYVVGMGGAPGNPKELYLIKSKDLLSESVSKDWLKLFRKTGKMVYNIADRRVE